MNPRIIRCFAYDDFVVYIVDPFFVRNNLAVEFCLGGHFYRYSFIPENEIWIEPVQNKLDQDFNLAHEIIERWTMKHFNYSYLYAHKKSLKFEETIRRAKVEKPIELSLKILLKLQKRKTRICEI